MNGSVINLMPMVNVMYNALKRVVKDGSKTYLIYAAHLTFKFDLSSSPQAEHTALMDRFWKEKKSIN